MAKKTRELERFPEFTRPEDNPMHRIIEEFAPQAAEILRSHPDCFVIQNKFGQVVQKGDMQLAPDFSAHLLSAVLSNCHELKDELDISKEKIRVVLQGFAEDSRFGSLAVTTVIVPTRSGSKIHFPYYFRGRAEDLQKEAAIVSALRKAMKLH